MDGSYRWQREPAEQPAGKQTEGDRPRILLFAAAGQVVWSLPSGFFIGVTDSRTHQCDRWLRSWHDALVCPRFVLPAGQEHQMNGIATRCRDCGNETRSSRRSFGKAAMARCTLCGGGLDPISARIRRHLRSSLGIRTGQATKTDSRQGKSTNR